MSPSLIASKAAALVFLFPLNVLILLVISASLLRGRVGRRKAGMALLIVAMLSLGIAATPVVSTRLMRTIETEPAIPPARLQGIEGDPAKASAVLGGAEAIVVLSGGIALAQPEFGSDAAGSSTLERIRYGAYLHRKTGLPLLVTGGPAVKGMEPSARVMQRELTTLFDVPVRWVEPDATNTAENAQFSRDMLSREGVDNIVLVTSASHMRRARASFEKAGFQVLSAPTGFHLEEPATILRFIPKASALSQTDTVLHEWMGILWYRLLGAAD